MTGQTNDKLAVLIDADNAQTSPIHELLEEVSRYGTASVKRAYGDWSTLHLNGWKNELHRHAIKPIQQFSYTTGKNATDSALIIDAMDLLHKGNLNGFCLVSSDSDFTPLATRIRESGLVVYGFGEKKTPQPFVDACNKFIRIETLKPPTAQDSDKNPKAPSPTAQDSSKNSEAPLLKKKLLKAIEESKREDGSATLSAVGSTLRKNDRSFDQRTYGFARLIKLVQNQPYLEVLASDNSTTPTSVRIKTAS